MQSKLDTKVVSTLGAHVRNHLRRNVVIFQFLYMALKNEIFVLWGKSGLRNFSKCSAPGQDIFQYYESQSLQVGSRHL